MTQTILEQRDRNGIETVNFRRQVSTINGRIRNPFFVTPAIDRIIERYTGQGDPLEICHQLFLELKKDIKFDFYSASRPNGSKTSGEVVESGSALCLEFATLFQTIADRIFGDRQDIKCLTFDVLTARHRVELGHSCNGILVKTGDKTLAHGRFERDMNFRQRILKKAGITDAQGMTLILIDVSSGIFGAKFDEVDVIDRQTTASYHYSNSGHQFGVLRDQKRMVDAYDIALDLDPNNEHAMLHLFGRLSEQQEYKKIIEIGEKYVDAVDPEVVQSHILALLAMVCRHTRDFEKGKKFARMAILKAKNEPENYCVLAAFEFADGNIGRAISLVEKANEVAKISLFSNAREWMGAAHLKKDEDAMVLRQRNEELGASLREKRFLCGCLKALKLDLLDAVEKFSKNHDDAASLEMRGYTYLFAYTYAKQNGILPDRQQLLLERAAGCFKKAIKLSDRSDPTKMALDVVTAEMGSKVKPYFKYDRTANFEIEHFGAKFPMIYLYYTRSMFERMAAEGIELRIVINGLEMIRDNDYAFYFNLVHLSLIESFQTEIMDFKTPYLDRENMVKKITELVDSNEKY